MDCKIEIYWEVYPGSDEPTVWDLIRQKKIPIDSVCRIEPDQGVMKNYLEIRLPYPDRQNSDRTDLLIAEAIRWVSEARERFGVRWPKVMLNGCMLSGQVLRLRIAVDVSVKVLLKAAADLKATRSSVRNQAVADVRRQLEEIASRVQALTE